MSEGVGSFLGAAMAATEAAAAVNAAVADAAAGAEGGGGGGGGGGAGAGGLAQAVILPPRLSPRSKSDSTVTRVHKIVLTGGPCGGKTTAMARLKNFLLERGFRVFTVPEAATLFWANGMSFADLSSRQAAINFQVTLLRTQIHLEDTLAGLARITGCEKAVLLCDRGAMDGKAYLDEGQWAEVLKAEPDWDNVTLRDQRYNAVFHMVTAADGAAKFYGSDTNETRYESAEEAIVQDKNTQRAWLGHHTMTVLDNGTDFESKLRRLVARVSQVVGIPTTQRVCRKFLVRCIHPRQGLEAALAGAGAAGAAGAGRSSSSGSSTTDSNDNSWDAAACLDPNGFADNAALKAALPVPAECFDVEKIYPLQRSEDEQRGYIFARKRTGDGVSSYGLTIGVDGSRAGQGAEGKAEGTADDIELKRIINRREYHMYRENADPARHIVGQKRITFHHESAYFSVNCYTAPKSYRGLAVLYVQSDVNRNPANPAAPSPFKPRKAFPQQQRPAEGGGGAAAAGGEGKQEREGGPAPAAPAAPDPPLPRWLPAWLEVEREVTGDKLFSSRFISSKEAVPGSFPILKSSASASS